MICEELRADADALALGALPEKEASQAELHLASCDDCKAEYEAALRVAGQLPLSAPLVEAPWALRAAVFGAINSDTAGDRVSRSGAGVTGTPVGSRLQTTTHAAVPGGRNALRSASVVRFRRVAFYLPTLAAAAMFIAIVGLGVWTLRLHNQVQDLKKSEQAASRLRISEPALARADTDALLLLSAPGTIKAPLTAGAAAPNANGAVFWSREQQRCVIFARELTPLRGGSEYHVWFSAGAAYWDGGPLIPDTTGVAEMVVSTERWHPGESYIINIVIQPVPDDGSRRPVLSASIEQDVE